MSILSSAHSTPGAEREYFINRFGHAEKFLSVGEMTNANPSMAKLFDTIAVLKGATKGHPYYKYNSMWSREIQNAVCLFRWHH